LLTSYLNIFILFLLIFLGYFLSYRQWFTNDTVDVFSKIVLNLSLPFSMFLNITANFSKKEFLALFSGMIIPLLSMLLTLGISFLCIRLFKVRDSHKGTFSTIFTCSNTIFIGLPINLAIFGEKAIPFVLLYYIVNTTIFWTIGVFLIARDNPLTKEARISFHPLVMLKKIFSPALIGFIIGLIFMLLSWRVPNFIVKFGSYLADLSTPLSMFAIGIMVYFIGIKNLKLEKDIVLVLLGRYLVSPLIVWLLGRFIEVPSLMLKVFMVQAAMPVQNSIPILARNYQGDEKFASASLCYSIFFYLPFIWLLLSFL